MTNEKKERGAAAVELAIILPLLLLLLLGIMEFGRAYNVQISLSQAAREGARHAAIHWNDDDLDVEGTALAAAPSLDGLPVEIADNADSCGTADEVEVTATVDLGSMTGFFDVSMFGLPPLFPVSMTGVGVMRCGG